MDSIEKEKQFKSWEAVIKNYIDSLGDSEKKGEYLEEVISHHYYIKILSAKNKSTDDKQIGKEIKKVSNIKLTAKNKKRLHNIYFEFVKNNWIKDEKEFFANLERKDDFYNIWVNRACFSPEGILPATHVAKLSHSGNSASSILDVVLSRKESYLSTSNVNNKNIDGAYPDAKYSKIVKFFMLMHNSVLLNNEIQNYCSSPFSSFSESEEEISFWLDMFNRIINQKPKGSYLVKQIYFPVDPGVYHSLIVLKSSALMHHVFTKLFEKSERKMSEKRHAAIKKGKYLSETNVDVPNVSKLLTTQSQPQNVSVLNGKRGGIIRLFSCQPPTWQSPLKPSVYRKSLFDNLCHANIKIEIDYLRDFLLHFNKLDLSIKDPKRKWHLERWVNNIIDEFLFYVGSIQALPAGWTNTEGVKLKSAHQYLLDPYRLDEEFQRARKSTDWQAIIYADFAQWLNYQLRGKDKQFTPKAEHTRLWKKLLSAPLREYMESIEMEVKQLRREVV